MSDSLVSFPKNIEDLEQEGTQEAIAQQIAKLPEGTELAGDELEKFLKKPRPDLYAAIYGRVVSILTHGGDTVPAGTFHGKD